MAIYLVINDIHSLQILKEGLKNSPLTIKHKVWIVFKLLFASLTVGTLQISFLPIRFRLFNFPFRLLFLFKFIKLDQSPAIILIAKLNSEYYGHWMNPCAHKHPPQAG